MNMTKKLFVFFALIVTVSGLAYGQDSSNTTTQQRRKVVKKTASKTSRAAAKKAKKGGETVNQLLQTLGTRGKNTNIAIKKHNAALPEVQHEAKAPVPLSQVKPPRSNELFHDTGTDEEKLEQITEQGIQELYKLTQQYSKSPNRGELWLRLAELYVEKAKYIEYRLQKEYDDKLALYLAKKGPKPVLNLAQSREYNVKAIRLYEFYVHDFPKSPKIDQALFFLGYNYVELDQVKKGVAYYQRLTKEYPNSPYVSEAYFALGEYYFDNDKWADSLKSYTAVLGNRRARLYTFALYKIAWCQYRLGRAGQGLKTLEQVVALSRAPQGGVGPDGHKMVSKIRLGSEALKDIVLFYADVGNYKTAKDYFFQIGGEKAQYVMLEKLAYLLSDSGRKDEAMYLFKELLEYNPTAPKAFDYQYQIVVNLSTSKNQGLYRNELYSWIDNFGPESEWAKTNAQNKKLLDDSYTLRESALRNFVILLHKNAQNTQRKNDLAATRQAYEFFLSKFPDAPKSNEMRFFYAELLYSLADFPDAAREYRTVADKEPKGKYFEQAVLNTLLALEKGLKNDDQIRELVGENLGPVPFGPAELAFMDSGERYLKFFPKGEKAVDVKFKMGRLHYAYNHFDDAIKVFKQLVADHPHSPYAVYAANLILDIYNLRKDYTSLAREGKAFMHNKALIEAGFQTDVRDLVEKASFKKAQDLEVQKDYEGSAKSFSEFYGANPQSSMRQSAAFNAGVNYERAHDIPDAIVYYQKTIVAPKGNENLKKKSALLLARLYEQTAQYDKAAEQFERYAKENPKDKETPDLYYNAAVIWQGEKRFYPAINDYQKYYDIAGHRKDRNRALFTIAEIQEKMGHLKAAQEAYQKYLDAGGGNPELVVEANFKIGDLSSKRGHEPEAEKAFKRTVAVQKSLAAGGKNVGLVYAAEAKFRLTETVYNDFRSIRIPANPKHQAEAIKNKLALLTKLSNNLADVIKYDEGNMVIASLTKLGQAYEHMSKAIWAAPVPKDLNKQEQDAYKKGVDGVAKPLQDQAIQNYTAAINKSYEINFYNKWTKIALDAMAQYQPDKYAEAKEVVIPVARTDDMGLQ